MGITLRDLIFNVGGGISSGKAFKAVQTEGPPAGCIPASLLDLPVDFESLTDAVDDGSGGMIVMDEETCMVVLPAIHGLPDGRIGWQVRIVREGFGTDAAHIAGHLRWRRTGERPEAPSKNCARWVAEGSCARWNHWRRTRCCRRCAIFHDEYLAHINERRCPAGWQALITYQIDPEACTGAAWCLRKCPEAPSAEPKKRRIRSIKRGVSSVGCATTCVDSAPCPYIERA